MRLVSGRDGGGGVLQSPLFKMRGGLVLLKSENGILLYARALSTDTCVSMLCSPSALELLL